MDTKQKHEAKVRRHRRVRRKVNGTAERPRLAVFRSNRHVYAQLIDDVQSRTVASASDRETGAAGAKTDRATAVGKLIAERAKAAGVTAVVFDRGGRLYHGRVAAVAKGAIEGGLKI
ncbi:MAG: 50S ribosomal protein L18 [Actinomycetota bacterium]